MARRLTLDFLKTEAASGAALGLAAQGREAAEVVDPFGVAQEIEPHLAGGPIVAEAQGGLRKLGRADGVAVILPKVEEARVGAVG